MSLRPRIRGDKKHVGVGQNSTFNHQELDLRSTLLGSIYIYRSGNPFWVPGPAKSQLKNGLLPTVDLWLVTSLLEVFFFIGSRYPFLAATAMFQVNASLSIGQQRLCQEVRLRVLAHGLRPEGVGPA